jgi:hypothetical protein
MKKPRQKTFRAWLEKKHDADTIRDIANHGTDAGWAGLTYYSDTVVLYDAYEAEIWDAITDDASEFGAASPMAFIASWKCADGIESDATFKNACVWYMAERTSRQISDESEGE